MHQPTRYEQLIGEKLQQLPVPDMADAIWARIEAQLDIDLPTDDGPTPPSNPPGSGPLVIGGIGLVVIVALITVFLTRRKEPHPVLVTPQATPQTTQPQSLPAQTERGGAPGKAPTVVLPQKGETNKFFTNTDSVVAPVVQLPADTVSTLSTNAPRTMPPLALPVDTATPVKRPRGVPLNDEDYRIVPKKKDSGR